MLPSPKRSASKRKKNKVKIDLNKRKRLLLLLFLFLIVIPLSLTAPDFNLIAKILEKEAKVYPVWITAYSSSPDETDDNPESTASGTTVRNGIIAANFLPFGSLIKIPKLFGDQIFIVEDRLHSRKQWVVDVWMPSKKEAADFGSHFTQIVIIKKT